MEVSTQLINIHVSDTNDGTTTVEFQGEGGELVSVKMAAGDGVESDAAVNRAKAVMVQLTTFAEDRDLAEDAWERTQDDDSSYEKRKLGSSEQKPEVANVSPFEDAPSSAA